MQPQNDHRMGNSFKVSIANFLQRFRGFLVIGMVLVLGGLIGAAVWYELDKQNQIDLTSKYENLEEKVANLKNETDTAKKETLQKEVENLFKDWDTQGTSFPKVRALSLKGQYAYDRKDFDGALSAFKAAATLIPGNFLNPVNLFNCATTAEQKGDLKLALEFLDKAIKEYPQAPQIPEIMFTKGRLLEAENNISGAKEVYSQLQDKFPGKTWTNAARNRIILLGNK